jgi:dehydrogenase/reductase SDR family protein 12
MRLLDTLLARAAEATVVLGYSAPGYRLNRRLWDDPALDVDLQGKRCVITGANAGLGFAAARALATRGASVDLVCRNPERGDEALQAVRAEARFPDRCVLHTADLSSLRQTSKLGGELRAGAPLHALVLNAGVLLDSRQVTAEGLEVCLATNLLSGFLLLRQLREHFAADGRVVHVSSGGMYSQRLDVGDLAWEARPWAGVAQYARTKRAQVVLNELWAERLAIGCHCMHPGWAATPGVARSLPTFDRLLRPILRTSEQGADTIAWLCVASGLPSGRFWFDRKARATHIRPGTREPSAERQRLWQRCEQLVEAAGAGEAAEGSG